MTQGVPRTALGAALAASIACAGLVVSLVVANFATADSAAVDDLPRVAEVIVAAAHDHGIDLPELTDAEREALEAAPVDATDASAYEQLSAQLSGVLRVDGLAVAVELLGEAAAVSDAAEELCPRLFAELVDQAPGESMPGEPRPTNPCP